jgi:hypothetical protein
MDQMAKELGLVRRGNRWIYRRRVPEDLRGSFGRREIKESLRTEVYAEAKVRRNAAALRWDRLFAQRRRQISFTQIRSDVVRYVAEQSQARTDNFLEASLSLEERKEAYYEARADVRLYRDEPDSDEARNELDRVKLSVFPSLAVARNTMPVPEFDPPDITSHLTKDQASAVNQLIRQAALELAMRDADLMRDALSSRGHNQLFTTATPILP